MRTKILVIILLLLGPYANAKQVTQEMAQQTAQEFLLKEQTAPPQVATKIKGQFIVRNEAAGLALGDIHPITDEHGDILAYVQELEPQGFIITSADDAIRPVLGFSFNEKFPFAPTQGNPLLNLITTDIRARKNAISLGAVIRSPVATSLPTVQWGPWLVTDWNQRDHFNDVCPDVPGESYKCAAGCVATAFAQILNYWDNTKAYEFLNTVSFGPSDAYVSKGKQGNISIDSEASTYDFATFAEVTDYFENYSYGSTYETYLSYAAGIAVKMNYGYQSGQKTSKVAGALRDKFLFGSARSDSWPFVWSRKEDEVIDNIKNEMPVQAAINYYLFWNGHSVVLDGYRTSDEYFHVNMGWPDTSVNWWYDLPIIETDQADFNLIKGVVYDIQPNQCWTQYGADAQNTFSSPYPAPDGDEIWQKWRASCPSGYSFSNILIGTSNHVYAAVSTNASSGHPFVYVIDQFGTTLRQIELDQDGDIEFMCQIKDGELFAAMEDGQIYRVDPKQGSAVQIFAEPNGHQIQTLKIDEEGWLFAVTFWRVYALTRTGALRWAAPFVIPGSDPLILYMPAIDVSRQRIYIPYYEYTTKHAYLVAVNRLNGQTAQPPRDFGVTTLPAPRGLSLGNDGSVYVRVPGILYALNPDDLLGTPRWTKSLLITQTPAVGRDGTLYFPYWEESKSTWYNRLGAFDPSNGATRWTIPFQLDPSEEDIFQPYIASNGVVIFTIEHDGTPKTYTLHAYKDNGSSAEELWDYNAWVSGGAYAFGPGRTVYAHGMTGLADTIYALSDGDVGDPYGGGMDFADNNPPISASNPSPADGADGQDTDSVQLSWDCSDPDGHALKYDIYACALVDTEEAAFVPVASQITENSYWLTGLQEGTQYLWSVVATDGQAIAEGPVWSFVTTSTGVAEESDQLSAPDKFALFQNYPNPFNPMCEIAYALPTDCQVTLSVYNILGQKVRVLVDEYQSAGNKSVKWDGKDEQGQDVTSGVYFYRIQAGDFAQSKKMVLLK